MQARSPIPGRTLLVSLCKPAVIAQAQGLTFPEKTKSVNKGLALLMFERHVPQRHDPLVIFVSTHAISLRTGMFPDRAV